MWTLPNCRSIRCKILCAAWWFIVCAHEFSLAERKFEEKSPFVQANYRSICREISCELSSELSSKNHGNKERNSRISLALLLHNTVHESCGNTSWSHIPLSLFKEVGGLFLFECNYDLKCLKVLWIAETFSIMASTCMACCLFEDIVGMIWCGTRLEVWYNCTRSKFLLLFISFSM